MQLQLFASDNNRNVYIKQQEAVEMQASVTIMLTITSLSVVKDFIV
jgi:hypothetical protein